MSAPQSHGRALVRSMAFLEFSSVGTLNANQTQHMGPGNTETPPASAGDARYRAAVPGKRAMRLVSLRVYVGVAPTSDFVVVFTVIVNGVATGITCTLRAGERAAYDLENSAEIDPGDTVSLRTVTTNTAGVSPSFIHASLCVDEIP